MKISQIPDAFRVFTAVQKKDDGQSRRHQNPEQNSKKKKDDEQSDFPEITDDSVNAAVQSFSEDSQANASGLSAVSSGTGPGLRVILKDGTGAVVRQFTGEEFLRLRDAVSKDGRSSGKILDRKL